MFVRVYQGMQVRLLRLAVDDTGMSTAEYSIG